MNIEVGQWVRMLTANSGEAVSPEAVTLEAACRAAEAQLLALRNDSDPDRHLAELEDAILKLRQSETELKQECAELDAKIQRVFARRRDAALRNYEAASRQNSLSGAIELIGRTGAFFNMDFSVMSPAEIAGAKSRIARKLGAARGQIARKIDDARKALEEHSPVQAQIRKMEAERAEIEREIERLEGDLAERHHVRPEVIEALHNFEAEHLTAYREDVVRVLVNDARHEAGFALPTQVLQEVE